MNRNITGKRIAVLLAAALFAVILALPAFCEVGGTDAYDNSGGIVPDTTADNGDMYGEGDGFIGEGGVTDTDNAGTTAAANDTTNRADMTNDTTNRADTTAVTEHAAGSSGSSASTDDNGGGWSVWMTVCVVAVIALAIIVVLHFFMRRHAEDRE